MIAQIFGCRDGAVANTQETHMNVDHHNYNDARPYLFVWDGDGINGTLTVVGPFSTYVEAAAWATDPSNNVTDDPCWQTLWLTDPAKVNVLAPGSEAQAAVRAMWPSIGASGEIVW
jgi:hypothetical protein